VQLTVDDDARLERNETFFINLNLPRSSAQVGGQLGAKRKVQRLVLLSMMTVSY